MTAPTPAPSTPAPARDDHSFQRLVDILIRVGLILVLVAWCFDIIRPFLLPVLWGAILAVALNPAFQKLQAALGNRPKLAATVFTLVGIALIVGPSYLFFAQLIGGSADAVKQLSAGTFEIPPPDASVADWPLVGETLHAQWLAASQDFEGTLRRFGPEIRGMVSAVAGTLAGLGMDVVMFLVSLLLTAVFLATSSSGAGAFRGISRRLAGDEGDELARITADTIQNVAKGVVGVALIQTFLCGIGIFVAGIPLGGLWILLILIFAVVQLPPTLILLPLIIYQFSAVDTVPAVIFMVWSLAASFSDMVLKPLMLGRGMKTPMLVILIGAIGGMIWAGMIGLFVGAVVLALGWELFQAWLKGGAAGAESQPERA